MPKHNKKHASEEIAHAPITRDSINIQVLSVYMQQIKKGGVVMFQTFTLTDNWLYLPLAIFSMLFDPHPTVVHLPDYNGKISSTFWFSNMTSNIKLRKLCEHALQSLHTEIDYARWLIWWQNHGNDFNKLWIERLAIMHESYLAAVRSSLDVGNTVVDMLIFMCDSQEGERVQDWAHFDHWRSQLQAMHEDPSIRTDQLNELLADRAWLRDYEWENIKMLLLSSDARKTHIDVHDQVDAYTSAMGCRLLVLSHINNILWDNRGANAGTGRIVDFIQKGHGSLSDTAVRVKEFSALQAGIAKGHQQNKWLTDLLLTVEEDRIVHHLDERLYRFIRAHSFYVPGFEKKWDKLNNNQGTLLVLNTHNDRRDVCDWRKLLMLTKQQKPNKYDDHVIVISPGDGRPDFNDDGEPKYTVDFGDKGVSRAIDLIVNTGKDAVDLPHHSPKSTVQMKSRGFSEQIRQGQQERDRKDEQEYERSHKSDNFGSGDGDDGRYHGDDSRRGEQEQDDRHDLDNRHARKYKHSPWDPDGQTDHGESNGYKRRPKCP
jgi:hypothetical protein